MFYGLGLRVSRAFHQSQGMRVLLRSHLKEEMILTNWVERCIEIRQEV